VETLVGAQFPCAMSTSTKYKNNGGTTTEAQQAAINLGGLTVYDDPEFWVSSFLTANPLP
jgi:hypothetical protein